jgi:hypothetical protein
MARRDGVGNGCPSGGEPRAALRPPSLEDRASGACLHARPEAVFLGSTARVRLIRPLGHEDSLRPSPPARPPGHIAKLIGGVRSVGEYNRAPFVLVGSGRETYKRVIRTSALTPARRPCVRYAPSVILEGEIADGGTSPRRINRHEARSTPSNRTNPQVWIEVLASAERGSRPRHRPMTPAPDDTDRRAGRTTHVDNWGRGNQDRESCSRRVHS